MKIAFFHELPYGGARRAVLEFGKEIHKNHQADLYYIDDHKEKGVDGLFTDVKFIKLIPRNWTGEDWKSKFYKDTIELIKLYRLHKRLAREIDSKGYDFVFVHGSKFTQAPFLLRFLKTKSVYYCQEPLRMVYEDLFAIPNSLSIERKIYERANRKIRKIIDRQNIKKAKILLANSKFTKQNIKNIYELDSTVCYMGVDTSRFFPQKTEKIYDVLFVGSRDDIDGYGLLSKAIGLMSRKPKVRWLLREEEWISDDSVMRRIYSESKILVCLAYKEPFGLLPIEAQACGTPVLAVKEGGYIDSVIDQKTGVLIKRDPKKIAEGLSDLLINQKKITRLSKQALENVRQNWTWEANTKRLLDTVISK